MSTPVETLITILHPDGATAMEKPVTGSTFTADSLIAIIPPSFKGTGPVRLATQANQSALIDGSTNLIGTVGVQVNLVLKRVNRYTSTRVATGVVKVLDYIPGTEPTGPTKYATFVEAFRSAFGAATGGGEVYGIRDTPDDSPVYSESTFTFKPNSFYKFMLVQRYTMEYRDVDEKKIVQKIVDYEFQQTPDTLKALNPLSTSPFVEAMLFANDGTLTEANIKTKFLAAGQLAAGSYLVRLIVVYQVKVPAKTISDSQTEDTFPFYYFKAQLPGTVVSNVADGTPYTATASDYALYTADTAEDQSYLQELAPGLYILTKVYTILVKQPIGTWGGSNISVRARGSETVEDFLKRPNITLYDDALTDAEMLVLYDDDPGTTGVLVQMNTTVQEMVDDSLTTVYLNKASFTTVQVSYAQSTIPEDVYQTRVPLTGTCGSLEDLALAYYGVEETSTVKFALFEKINDWKIREGATTVTSTSVTEFTLQELIKGSVRGTGSVRIADIFLPKYANAKTMAKYIQFNKSALGVTVADVAGNAIYVVHNDGSDVTPYMPWQLIKDVNPTFSLAIKSNQDGTVVELVTESNKVFKLDEGNAISVKHTANQYIQWAKYLDPTLDVKTAVYTITSRDNALVPVFYAYGPLDLPAPSYSASTTSRYIMLSQPVKIYHPVQDGKTPPIETNLPSMFTVYDLINYSIQDIWDIGSLDYKLTLTNDSKQQAQGQMTTLAQLQAMNPTEVPLQLSLAPDTLHALSVVYNDRTTSIRNVGGSTRVDDALKIAASIIGLGAGMEFEAVSAAMPDKQVLGVKGTDPISKYGYAGATSTDAKQVVFVVQVKVKMQVVLSHKDTGLMLLNPKVSAAWTLADLLDYYRMQAGLRSSVVFKIYQHNKTTELDQTNTLSAYDEKFNPATDAAKENKDDKTPIQSIAEFDISRSTNEKPITVQGLFNIPNPQQISVPVDANLRELAQSAAALFGVAPLNVPPKEEYPFALFFPSKPSVVLQETDAIDFDQVYRLSERAATKSWVGLHVHFSGRTDDLKDYNAVVAASTKLSEVKGVMGDFDFVRLSPSGDNLSNLEATVGSFPSASGELNLYIVQKANISVVGEYVGQSTTLSLPVRATVQDMLTKLDIVTGTSVKEKATNTVADKKDYIAGGKFSLVNGSYVFSIVDFAETQTIIVEYNKVRKNVQVKDLWTVAQATQAAMAAFNVTGTFSLAVDAGKVTLTPTDVIDWSKTDEFILVAGVSNIVYIGAAAVAAYAFGLLG